MFTSGFGCKEKKTANPSILFLLFPLPSLSLPFDETLTPTIPEIQSLN
jgi:hypothetical protein